MDKVSPEIDEYCKFEVIGAATLSEAQQIQKAKEVRCKGTLHRTRSISPMQMALDRLRYIYVTCRTSSTGQMQRAASRGVSQCNTATGEGGSRQCTQEVQTMANVAKGHCTSL